MVRWLGLLVAVAVAGAGTSEAAGRKAQRSQRTRLEAKGQQVYKQRSQLATVARRSLPAVVSIATRQPADKDTPPGEESQRGLGSGFIISPDGYILTSLHVVEGASEITVTLLHPAGYTEELEARVVGQDPQTDSALLKIDASRRLPVLKMGSAKNVEVADWIVVIGNPFGLSHSVSVGVVSYKGRTDVTPAGRTGYFDYLQTDASINPGNSGGPILDLNGEVVAIANAVNVAGQGIGFAVPIDIARTILPQLKTRGYVKRGWIGISVQDVTADLAATLGMPAPRGVLVSDVIPEGPAFRAGLREGDVITGLDTAAVTRAYSLRWNVASHQIGKSVQLHVLRDGKPMRFKVKLGEAPLAEPELPLEPELATGGSGTDSAGEGEGGAELGAIVSDVDEAASDRAGLANPFGALVREVDDGSVLSGAGLLSGDVVLKVNGAEIETKSEFLATLAQAPSGEVVRLFVRRGEQTLALAFRKP